MWILMMIIMIIVAMIIILIILMRTMISQEVFSEKLDKLVATVGRSYYFCM